MWDYDIIKKTPNFSLVSPGLGFTLWDVQEMGWAEQVLGARITSGTAEGCGKWALPVNLRVSQEVTVLHSLPNPAAALTTCFAGLAEVNVDQLLGGCIISNCHQL